MKRSVLIVDDQPLILELLADILRDMDRDVWTARHGAEALQVLERNPHISVLLTDVNMPGMSGHELAERARRVREGLQVLMLSGRESDGHGYPIVRKPFARHELHAAMSRTVGSAMAGGRPPLLSFALDYQRSVCRIRLTHRPVP